jgi:hypothetical protein
MRANTAESLNQRTLDVGTYPGGRSVYGCHDMAGNAQEYCLDSFEQTTYRYLRRKDPCLVERAPMHDRRVVRGGNWNHLGFLHKARCTARGMIPLLPRYPTAAVSAAEYLVTGIRVVLSPVMRFYPEADYERLIAERDRARAAAAAQAELVPPKDDGKSADDGAEEEGDGGADDGR